MKISIFGWSKKSEDFVIGKDNFSDLEISSTPPIEQFYYFFHRRERRLITQFVLSEKKQVDYICKVNLIKKADKFTPRLSLSVRDKNKKIVEESETSPTNIRANVSLDECHENFWKLISFLQSLRDIELPKDKFSLMSQDEGEIVSALRGRGPQSVVNIIKQLSAAPDILVTQKDINSLLKRREKLAEFKQALGGHSTDESWWQNFFEGNKWIFGYGLNYQILRQQQLQPNYGGTRVNGRGGQIGDSLMSTVGDLNFTVLVEIKTPATKLLQGTREIRNGAWSLSQDLTDSLSQIQANIQIWEKWGSEQPDNRDELEKISVFTVKPKGIIVIGSLSQLTDRDRRETFQRFRKSIHGIDIITFDELFERAKFIIEND
ncbi:MAG: Shedu immune nuclease family protein [Candidatus Paceibacterota bacterium]